MSRRESRFFVTGNENGDAFCVSLRFPDVLHGASTSPVPLRQHAQNAILRRETELGGETGAFAKLDEKKKCKCE